MSRVAFDDAAARSRTPALPGNMGALTSLRALLAWWVVVFHLAPLAPFHFNQSAPALHKGPVLVDCFFILSGFVLFHVHPIILAGTAKSGASNRQAVAQFLVARFARLYPTHLAMLAAFVLLIGALHLATGFHPANPDAFTAVTLVEQLLLLHGTLFPTYAAWNFPSWSVSSECAAYLLAPLLFRQINMAPRRALLLAGSAIAVLVIGGVETGWLTRSPALLVLRVTLEFSMGALLRVLAGATLPALLRLRRVALALGWSAILVLAPSSHPGLFLAAMIWLMLFLSLTPGWSGRTGAVCRYLGETSYGVYMCHAFTLTLWAGVQSRLGFGLLDTPVPAFLLVCVSVQGGACLLHHLVEIPGRRAVRSWADRRIGGRRVVAATEGQSVLPAPGTCASVSPSTSTT